MFLKANNSYQFLVIGLFFLAVGYGVFHKANHRRKGYPSLHQKQMRFFTVFFLVIVLALFAMLLWLVNKASYATH